MYRLWAVGFVVSTFVVLLCLVAFAPLVGQVFSGGRPAAGVKVWGSAYAVVTEVRRCLSYRAFRCEDQATGCAIDVNVIGLDVGALPPGGNVARRPAGALALNSSVRVANWTYFAVVPPAVGDVLEVYYSASDPTILAQPAFCRDSTQDAIICAVRIIVGLATLVWLVCLVTICCVRSRCGQCGHREHRGHHADAAAKGALALTEVPRSCL